MSKIKSIGDYLNNYIKIYVLVIYIFNSYIDEIKEIIDSNILGDIQYISLKKKFRTYKK